MRLSSLPPELLLQIIESTVPHTFHTRTYHNRQRTLCSLSLVSKQFYSIAQHLLYEIVWIKSPETLKRYQMTMNSSGDSDRGVAKAWRPKTAVIGSNDWDGSTQLNQGAILKEVAQVFSSVKSLTWDLNGIIVEDVPYLTGFSNLSSLHLSRIFSDPDNVAKLPKLESLTMFSVQGSLIASLLDPAVVPSLKHFSLVDTSDASVRELQQSRITNLLPQLETIYLSAYLWLNPDLKFLHSASERTLVDSNSWDWTELTGGAAQTVNLRLIDTYLERTRDRSDFVEDDLKQWVSILQAPSDLSLRSIYLDSSLRPQPALPPPIAAMMDEFRILCRRRSIELIFDVVPNDFRLDTWISAEFVKRQKIRQNEVESNRVGGGGRSQQG
ncbi:hypothetical protein JCM3765_005473 [Sporobolomyces pararoseus]